MDRTLNVIPISSRRPRPVPIARPVVSAPPVRRGGSVALLFGAALVLGGVVAVNRVQTIGSIRGLPLAERGALYQRTLDDTSAACGAPDARAGALRDHCLHQAEFLRLFPECDGRCQKLTASILPRAAR